MKCPHCAHENLPDAERCASCLQKLEEAVAAEVRSHAPAASAVVLQCAKCGTTNPPDARICSCCQGPLEPSMALPAETQPPAAPRRSGRVVGILVAAGILAGAFFAIREFMSSEVRPEDRIPVAPASSAAKKEDPRSLPVPKAVPQTEQVPTADSRAEEQYRLALAWLKRGDQTQARRSLEEVMRKFPSSPYAGRAQSQLEKMPPPSDSASVRRAQAIAEFRERYREESSKGAKHATITEHDIGGISKVPSDMKAPRVPIPPPESEPADTAQAPANRLTLGNVYAEDDQVTLKVSYQLGSPHKKSVHAAARLTYPAGNTVFAYGEEALARGSGETSIVMRLSAPIAVSRPASIRLMLFESQGPMFFSVTVPYP